MHIPSVVAIVGSGMQAASTAYFLRALSPNLKITVFEASSKHIAPHASSKGGGFLARDWGGGGATDEFHRRSFALHEELAEKLSISSYRKNIRVLSVQPGNKLAKGKDLPDYLNGKIGGATVMEDEADGGTAQVHPADYCSKVLEASGAEVKLGATVSGFEFGDSDDSDDCHIEGVKYVDAESGETKTFACDTTVICNGPWATMAEDWFAETSGIRFPMEGIKSASMSFASDGVDGVALFTGEDNRFSTHLEVYPRPNGDVYLCGIGGSDYVPADELRHGAYLHECEPRPERIQKGKEAFWLMSSKFNGVEPDVTQACMRPCPQDGLPVVCAVPNVRGAYINAGHNCWG